MAVLRDIAVCLETPHTHSIPTCAEEEDPTSSRSRTNSELSKPSNSTSSSLSHVFLEEAATTPGAPFQVTIESATPRPAGIPLDCEVLRVRVLIGGLVVIEIKEVEVGEQGRLKVVLREEGLRFAAADGKAAVAGGENQESTSDANLEDSRAIQVQLIPCRRALDRPTPRPTDPEQSSTTITTTTTTESFTLEPIPDCTLLYTFHPRTPVPRQEDSNNIAEFKNSEYNICCGRIFYGAPPDPLTGRIPHTGIVACSNEWCQRLGQAWHKRCAGMEIWEEPEGVWFCPECRVRPEMEMEVKFD